MQAQASKVKFDLGTVISSLTAKKNPDSLWTGPLVANLFVGGLATPKRCQMLCNSLKGCSWLSRYQ